jgi:hypothetical protein
MQALAGQDFPDCGQLNNMLPTGLCSAGGSKIRFVSSDLLDDGPYEHRIYTTGQVSTRPESWHDLFNAMVWMRFPGIKTAMNTLHFSALAEEKAGSRGKLRDALTLFDECGVIVFSACEETLQALAQRRWKDAFLNGDFQHETSLCVAGHAMLEKYLSPYKSMTAKALLVRTSPDIMGSPRDEALTILDYEIARLMLAGELLKQPSELSPLPLAGVPGWWPSQDQGQADFYDDLQVFRPAGKNLQFSPVFRLD